jgi:cytoskeletal protein CcmA (bactofilin family)
MNYEQVLEQDFSFMGRNNLLKGQFHLTGKVRLNCKVEGEMTAPADGEITLEASAEFNGQLKCGDVHLLGTFNGQLESSGLVTIWPSANVQGEIKAKSLRIYPGAFVQGETHTSEN